MFDLGDDSIEGALVQTRDDIAPWHRMNCRFQLRGGPPRRLIYTHGCGTDLFE